MKNKWTRLLAALLALTLVIGTLSLAAPASAVEIDRPCSITVNPSGAELAEDIAKADVVVDVYQVASAVEVAGYDTYSYNFMDGYTALNVPDGIDADGWAELAQKAAAIALEQTPIVQQHGMGKIDLTDGANNLLPGLYLLIAHERDLAEYTETDDDGKLSTIARSSEKIFSFAPVLVSLPGKPADEDGEMNTANPGEWVYDQTVTLKPSERERFGKLEIVKTLKTFEKKAYKTEYSGMFVFQVVGKLKDKEVYNNVVGLDFNGNQSEKSVVVDKIPVGASVTVTEVYSGASYTQTAGDNGPKIIDAKDTVIFNFVNDYETDNRSGHGIVNNFKAVQGTDHEWHWEPNQLSDNASLAG